MPVDRLLGRESEVAFLTQLLDGAPRQGVAMLVSGEPGIGKSALLDEVCRRASEREMRVLRTIGYQSEAQMPFAGLSELLRPILAHREKLPAQQRDALLGAFGAAEEAPDVFFTALAALNLLGDAAARSPILLVADDAQWLDAPSRQALAFLARRLESDPIVLLLAVRDGFGREVDRAGLTELHLEGLDDDAGSALLDRYGTELPSAARRRLLAESGGNPLALLELPLAWMRRGTMGSAPGDLPLTERMERAFAARVDELPSVTRAMLLIAALTEGGSLGELLDATQRLVGRPPALADLEPAEAAELIAVDDGGLHFRHALIRSAVPQMAGLEQRRAAHAALAKTLADQPDRAVWHAAAATVGADEAVASQLEATALRATRRGAATVAVSALRRSVALTEVPARRGARLLAAAELASELAEHDEVTQLLNELGPLELPAPERSKLVWLREFLADASGDHDVTAMVDCARTLISHDDQQSALRALLTAAMKCFWFNSDDDTRESVVATASQLPISADDAWLLAIYALATPGTRGEIIVDLTARITPSDLLRQMPDQSKAIEAMRLYALALTVVPDNERARVFQDAAIEGLRQQGRLAVLSFALGSQSSIAFALADWRLAARAGEEGLRLARETRHPRREAAAQLALAAVAASRGEFSDAEAMISDAERLLEPFRPCWPFPEVAVARATMALAAGSYSEAFGLCCRIFDPSDVSHHWLTTHWGLTLMDLADAAVHTGNVEIARGIMGSLPGLANSLEFRWGTSYAAALLADLDADPDPAFKSASASAPASEYAHARLQLAWGARLRRQRRVADSRRHLRAALEGFHALRATPWSDRAAEELRASGETSRRPVPDALDELSAQEIQIAMLAAEGLTNREIGAKLFLSHRTVGSHLYRIFPKLAITSRSELRGAMSRFESGSRERA